MNNVGRYVSGFFPEQYYIFGNKLRPLSLGHYLILLSIKSPFVDESDNTRQLMWEDIMFTFIICLRNWKDNMELINDAEATKTLFDKYNAEIVKQKDELKLDEVIDSLRLYFNKSFVINNFCKEEKSANIEESGTPWMQSIVNTLKSKLNYTEEEIMDNPINRTVADYLWCVEQEGGIRMLTDWEIEMIEQSKDEMKKHQETK